MYWEMTGFKGLKMDWTERLRILIGRCMMKVE